MLNPRNDAILPLHKTYPGCRQDKNGLCAVPTVVKGLTARLAQIDHHKVCCESLEVERADKSYKLDRPRS